MAKIDQLFWDVGLNVTPFMAGASKVTKGLGALTAAAKTPAGALAALGVAFALVGIQASKAAAEIDLALREVATLLPQTRAELDGLRKSIINLSTKVPEPPAQLTKGLYQVISAGVTNTADAMDVLTVASKAAVGGLTSTFNAVDAITTVLNAWSLEVEEATRVSDVLFQLVADGKIVFENINTAMGKVATTAGVAGVSLEEISAGLATLTKFGIDSIEAGNALNRLLFALVNSTDKQQAAAKRLGIEWSLAAVQAKGLGGFMADLNEKTGGNLELLAEVVPQIRAARSAFVIGGKGLDTYNKALNNALNSTGKAEKALGEVSGSLQKQGQLLKQNLVAPFLEFGQDILDALLIPLLTQINGLFIEQERAIRDVNDVLREQLLLARELGDEDSVKKLLIRQAVIKENARLQEATLRSELALRARADQLAQPEGFVGDRVAAQERLADMQFSRDSTKSAEEFKEELAEINEELQGLLDLEGERRDMGAQPLSDAESEQLATLKAQKATLLEIIEATGLREAAVERLNELAEGMLNEPVTTGAAEMEDGVKNSVEALQKAIERMDRLQELAKTLGVEFDEIPDRLIDSVDSMIELEEQAEAVAMLLKEHPEAMAALGLSTEDTIRFMTELARQGKNLGDELERAAEMSMLQHEIGLRARLEGGGELARPGQAPMDDLTLSAQQLTAAFARLQDAQNELALAEMAGDTDLITAAQERLDKELGSTQKLLKRYAALLAMSGKSSKEIAAEVERLKEILKGIDDLIGSDDPWSMETIGELVEDVGRGMLGIADAFDLLDDKSRKLLEGIVDIGSAVASVAEGIATGNPAAIVGGVVKGLGGVSRIVSGLFGAGPDNSDLIESQADLIQALKDLEFAVINGLSANEFAKIQERLATIDKGDLGKIDDPQLLADLREVEKFTRIDFLDGNKISDIRNFVEATTRFLNADFGAFPKDIDGRIEAFNFQVRVLGDAAGSAADKFELLLKQLETVADAKPFVAKLRKIFEEEGLEAAMEWLQGWSEALADPNNQSIFSDPLFADLNAQEIQQLIEETNDWLREIAEEQGTADGQTEGFRISREITERTAGIMVSALTTMIFRLENIEGFTERAALAAEMLAEAFIQPIGVSPPSVDDEVGTAGGRGAVSVTVGSVIGEVTVGAGAELDPLQFEEVGRAAGRGFAEEVDRSLHNNRVANSRALGV